MVSDVGDYVRAILAVRRANADEAIALVRESLTRIRELHDKFDGRGRMRQAVGPLSIRC